MRLRGHLAHQLVVTEDAVAPHLGVVFHALAPHLQPVGRRKVDGLGQVVAVVEAGVVAAREGDHELAGMLVGFVHGDAVGLKKRRKLQTRYKNTNSKSPNLVKQETGRVLSFGLKIGKTDKVRNNDHSLEGHWGSSW